MHQDKILTQSAQFLDRTAHIDLPKDIFNRERIVDVSSGRTLPTVLDLFAGAGGLSIGFRAAGYNVVGAYELDEWACDTIKHNFPQETVLSGDIRKADAADIKS